MKRRVLWLLAVILMLPTIVVGYAFWIDHSLIQPFEHIQRGDSESHVIARLGHPHRITGAPENVVWVADGTVTKNQGNCVKEFWYEPFSLTGEAYTVGFNSDGEVVSKYHYSSP